MITSLDQLDPNGIYTYADYLHWRLKERIELIRGKIFEMSSAPSRRHQEIAGNLYYLLRSTLGNTACKVFNAPFDVRLPKAGARKGEKTYTVVQPNLCVVCDMDKLDERGCEGAPDLVIEILSPGNSRKEMREKLEVHEESGVREYWIVSPTEKAVQVFLLDESQGRYYGLKPFVEGDQMPSQILPNLRVDLTDAFAE